MIGSLDGVMPQSEASDIPCPDAHLCRQTSDVICDVQPAPDAGAKRTGSLHHHWWDLERGELLWKEFAAVSYRTKLSITI